METMYKKGIKYFSAAVLSMLMLVATGFAQSPASRDTESCEGRMPASGALDRELLARAEDRAEELRTKLFELQMRQFDLQARVEDLDYQLTPDGIRKALAFVPSVRPMDELRETLRIKLESEKARVVKQLEILTAGKERLEAAIREADEEVERLRQSLAWSW
jgi:hypothetical protein